MKKALLLLALAGTASLAGAQTQPVAGTTATKLVAMCIGCHNIPGYQASFPEVHKVPMIAGQNAKYIVAALQAYKKGERKHPTMRGIATSLTDADMASIAGYYEQLGKGGDAVPAAPANAPGTEVAALLTKGACISCHGANFNQPVDASYPKIAGQHPDYLYVALKAYKSDTNPHAGRGNPIMAAQVKPLQNSELKAIANYIGSLPGELKTVPQSRFP